MLNKKVTPAPEKITKTWFYLKKIFIVFVFPALTIAATGLSKTFHQTVAKDDVFSATLSFILMILLGLITLVSIINAIIQVTEKYDYHSENKQVAPLYTQFKLYMELRKLYKKNHKLKDYNTIKSLTQISSLISLTIRIVAGIIAIWVFLLFVQIFASQSFSDTKVASDVTSFVATLIAALLLGKLLFVLITSIIDGIKPNYSNNQFDHSIKIFKSAISKILILSFNLMAISAYNPDPSNTHTNLFLTKLLMGVVLLIGIKGALMIFDHYINDKTANMLNSLFDDINFDELSDVATISKTIYDRLIEEKAQYIIDIDTVSLIDDVYINQELQMVYTNDVPTEQIDDQTIAIKLNDLHEVKSINAINDLSSKVQLKINFVIKNIGETSMVKIISKDPISKKPLETENTIN